MFRPNQDLLQQLNSCQMPTVLRHESCVNKGLRFGPVMHFEMAEYDENRSAYLATAAAPPAEWRILQAATHSWFLSDRFPAQFRSVSGHPPLLPPASFKYMLTIFCSQIFSHFYIHLAGKFIRLYCMCLSNGQYPAREARAQKLS